MQKRKRTHVFTFSYGKFTMLVWYLLLRRRRKMKPCCIDEKYILKSGTIAMLLLGMEQTMRERKTKNKSLKGITMKFRVFRDFQCIFLFFLRWCKYLSLKMKQQKQNQLNKYRTRKKDVNWTRFTRNNYIVFHRIKLTNSNNKQPNGS